MIGEDATRAVVSRVIGAPPEVVYDEWLDPDAMREWMCPRPARARRIDLEPRVGGRLWIDIVDGAVEFSVWGEFLTLNRPRLLAFTWTCSTWNPQLPSLVTVTLDPLGGDRTRMTIDHARLQPGVVAEHETGWTRILDQLDSGLRDRTGRARGAEGTATA